MTQRFSAPAWLMWSGSAAFLVLVTRNPLYLALVMVSLVAVYLSLEQRSTIALAWTTVLRIGIVIAGISILFNVLTVNVGDRQFGSLPESWPVIGGPLTWNAVLYGVISGLALLCLLLIAAILSTAVDRSALVRMMPQSMATIGIAAAVALSMFPQTIASIVQVREAHRARGLQIRSFRDVQRLIVPVLNLGLERAFNLAESMESRAFGNQAQSSNVSTPVAVSALILATTGVVLIGIGAALPGTGMIAITIVVLAFMIRRSRAVSVSRYRVSYLSRSDIPVVGAAALMAALTAIELLAGDSLLYSTYPTLRIPEFTVPVAVACALPAVPALLSGARSNPEPASA